MPRQPRALRESTRLAEAATSSDASSGRMRIQVLSPGWGTSGYYSPEVCEAAAALVPVGTQMFIDHPSESDRHDRPERSVRDIAAFVTEAARWDPQRQATVAECQVVGPYKEVLTDLAEHIGLSISGSATDIYEGEAEGRRGPIIEGLAAISSVDFVTRAGRGGRVLQVLESARHRLAEAVSDKAWSDFTAAGYDDSQWKRACLVKVGDDDTKGSWKLPVREPNGTLNRNGCHAAASVLGGGRGGVDATAEQKRTAARKLVGLYRNQLQEDPPESLLKAAGMSSEEADRRIAEATADERREQLSDAVRSAHGGQDRWAWVRDFDESTVWFDVHAEDEASKTWQQAYTVADDDMSVSLTGSRTEVRAVTKYVPVNPAGQSTTQESEEDTMPQIEEARLRELEEASGRVSTLESERDTAVRERDEARRERDTERARSSAADRARSRVTEANGNLHTTVVDRIVREATREVPLTDQGQLNEQAFDSRVDEARKAEETYLAGLAEAAGAGTVTGFGQSSGGGDDVAEADLDKAGAQAFGRPVKGD